MTEVEVFGDVHSYENKDSKCGASETNHIINRSISENEYFSHLKRRWKSIN